MDFLRQYLPTFLIFLPLAGAVALIWVPRRACRWTAFGVACGNFAASTLLTLVFDRYPDTLYAYALDGGVVQMTQRINLFRHFHMQFLLGIDGLNFPLILLTTFIYVPICLASWQIIERPKRFFQILLIAQAALLGSFLALDLALLFFFIQVSIVCICLLIWFWAGAAARRAAVKFLVCALLGSSAMLFAIVLIHSHNHSLDLVQLANIPHDSEPWARRAFLCVLFASLIWMAAFPLHAWLPEVHHQSPAPINMLISALFQNIGGYTLIRVAYPLFPEAAKSLWLALAILGVISILYGALCAIPQADLPRLIAYSSISQSGFVVLGIALATINSLNGALFVMIARGLGTAALLFISSALYDRARHHNLFRFGGLAWTMPGFTGFSIVAFLAAMGLPILAGFVGQFMVTLGLFSTDHPLRLLTRVLAPLVCFGAVLTAAFILRTIQRIFLGAARPEYLDFADISGREIAVLTPLTLALILLGTLPWFVFFTFTNRTVAALLVLWSH